MLTDDDKRQIDEQIATRLDAESIVAIFRDSMDERAKEELADAISRFMYDRQKRLPKPQNTYTPRYLLAGQDINNRTYNAFDPQDVVGYRGPTLPRVVNFDTGFQARLSASDPQQLDVKVALGAGADCLFDFLVSSCYATLAGFYEGKTFVTGSGCTYKGYSTIQGVWDSLAGTSFGAKVIALCGDAGPLAIDDSGGFGTVGRIEVVGFGAARINGTPANHIGYHDTSTGFITLTARFTNVIFEGYTSYAIDKPYNYGTHIELVNCRVLDYARVLYVLRAWNTDFDGVSNGSTVFALDCYGNNADSWLWNCSFSATMRPGDEMYMVGCTHTGYSAGGIAVDASAGSGSLNIQGAVFRLGAGYFPTVMKIGAYARISVRDCTVSACQTGILVSSSYNYDGTDAVVVGNDWGGTLGMDIQSTVKSLLYVGNSHGLHGGATFTAVRTSSGGTCHDAVFGMNGPSGASYSITGSNNRFEGILATTAAPTVAAIEGTLAFNRSANTLYVNTDGSTTWAIVGTTTGGAAAPLTGKFLTYTADASLSDNRVLAAGSGLSLTDAGTDDGAVTLAEVARVRLEYISFGSNILGYSV